MAITNGLSIQLGGQKMNYEIEIKEIEPIIVANTEIVIPLAPDPK